MLYDGDASVLRAAGPVVCGLFSLTVMRIIKLNLFPVPVRLHSGSG